MSQDEPTPEFSRPVDLRSIGDAPLTLEATEDERAALAERFGLVAIHSLSATLTLDARGAEVDASGRLSASIVQPCAVSGEDLAATIEEPLAFRFVPASERRETDEEIELEEEELDEIAYSGTAFDLGEAVAQSLALAIDPYATGPEADRVRDEQGLADDAPHGPLQDALAAALKGADRSQGTS